MDLSQVPLFSALAKRMAWLTDRQAVLAQNVANVDTSGYQARDMKSLDFRKVLSETAGSVSLVTTQPGHIEAKREFLGLTSSETVPMSTGGKVTVEDEMVKVSQTANDYALVSTVYRANLNMVKTVLGRSS